MKNSTLTKLNDLLKNIYTIEIKSFTDVCIDDYTEGEGEEVNGWGNDNVIFHTEPENLSTELLTSLTDYIEDVLFISLNKRNSIKEALANYDDSEYFYMSKFVDEDNCEPSELDIKQWKEGNTTLYVQNIRINIEINGNEIPADLLSEILFSD